MYFHDLAKLSNILTYDCIANCACENHWNSLVVCDMALLAWSTKGNFIPLSPVLRGCFLCVCSEPPVAAENVIGREGGTHGGQKCKGGCDRHAVLFWSNMLVLNCDWRCSVWHLGMGRRL